MIAPASISEVMSRADIVDVVGQFVRLKKRGANYIANCPFHNEKTPSFSVSASKGIYKCFGCGKAGNVVTFVEEHEKLTYPEAIRWLASYYKIEIEETAQTQEQQQSHHVEEALRVLNEFATQYFQNALTNTPDGQLIGGSYFTQRGFKKEIIERFRLGYNSEKEDDFYQFATGKSYSSSLLEKAGLAKEYAGRYRDVYRGRVIFPIQSMTGRILGFGARVLKNNERSPKYINTPENELYVKSKVLYGIYQSRQAISKLNECFLVEGYTDVISLHQCGIENVVASSGTSLTTDQLRLIGQLTHNLTILYDGDAPGIKAALRGLDMALGQSFNVQLLLLPDGDDPDSFVQKNGASRFAAYVKENKKDVIGFRLEIGKRDAGDDPVRISNLINEIAESISLLQRPEDFALRGHYVKIVSSTLGVDEAGMVNLVNKHIRDRIELQRREGKREDLLPSPPFESSNQGVPLGSIPPAQNDEEQEWQLLRVLIESGHLPEPEFGTISALIRARTDTELIGNVLARRLFEEYFDHVDRFNTTPDLRFFVHYPDPAVQHRMSGLLHTRNEISPRWKEKYGIESIATELNYVTDAESTLAYFELKKIIIMEEQLNNRIKAEKDPSRQATLQQIYLSLRATEKEIIRKHGTVVLKTLKKH